VVESEDDDEVDAKVSYALSRSSLVRAMANLLSSVPFGVRVGFVMGAEMKFEGRLGERGEGSAGSLS
jgi:hypothetical protein